jgi:transposase
LWDEYRLNHPDGYSYPQFCYHLKQLKVARHPMAILDHQTAEKLYVDFAGDTMSYIDRETGEVLKAHIFVACLPYSDYTFTMAVSSQTTDDFLYALSSALRHLGGSAKILTPDNLKAAVIKSDRYEPDPNRLMEDFANHYGFVVIPARSRHPRDKAVVENQVKIIYRRVYAKLCDTVFFSLAELNRALLEKTMEHNQTRMQQKPYTRQEKFLAEEKNKLTALSPTDFEVKYYAQLQVANNNCIYLGRDKHYYSVLYCHIGKKVQVIYTRTLVQIFCEGACVAIHRRASGYGYTTLREHLCSTHRHYKDRSPDYYIAKARERSHMLGLLVEKNFEQNLVPEMIYRRCDGLLSLQRKTDPVIFDQACRLGLSVAYHNTQKLMVKIKYARLDGSIIRFFEKLAKTELLILDDFGLAAMDNQQQLDLLEIIEDRHMDKATIIVSQLPVDTFTFFDFTQFLNSLSCWLLLSVLSIAFIT